MAISNWSPQSQRNEPSISPVRHCEWIRTSGTPFVTSPKTSAIALSICRLPLRTSRSKPTARNMPHLVGIRVAAIPRTVPVGAFSFIFERVPGLGDRSRLLRPGEIRPPLFKERCERLLGFRGAHPHSELVVLELYRPLKLFA